MARATQAKAHLRRLYSEKAQEGRVTKGGGVMTINLIDLKERIAISQEYTPEERDLILAALNIGGDYCDQHVHVYPSKYPRKSDSFWLNETWDIMDKLPPDAMPTNYR